MGFTKGREAPDKYSPTEENELLPLKPSRTLWGSWARKPFWVPRSLFVGNSLQPPGSSLSPKGQIQTVANQGREGMQRQGKSSQETIVQPWGRVLVLPHGIHITVSLSSL